MRALLVALVLLPTLALGQATTSAPRLLPYQGRLLRTDGTPETGTHTLTFRVYDAVTAGSVLWAEAQQVPLSNGFYAVFLGSVSTFSTDLFDGHDRWLGVTVDGEEELTPRQQIASVAYAITATNALRAAVADTATSATRASTAASADTATSAGYATSAGRASAADTATRTTRADRATTADTAATATNVSGGSVRATTVDATQSITSTGSVSSATLSVSRAATVADLVVTGSLSGAGLGTRVIGGVYTGLKNDQSARYGCNAWGDGACGAGYEPTCATGTLQLVYGGYCWVEGHGGDCYCYQHVCLAQ